MKKALSALHRFFVDPKFDTGWSLSVMAILLYCQVDSLLFSLNEKMRIVNLVILALVSFAVLARCILLKRPIFDFHSRLTLTVVTMGACMVLTLFLTIDNRFNFHRYFIQLGSLGLAYLLVLMTDIRKFLKSFVYVMLALTAVSLPLFLLYLIVPQAFSFLPTLVNSSGYEFKFAFVASFFQHRNWSIFREPGVFGVFLCLALTFVAFYREGMFRKEWMRYVALCILVLGIVSTASTTAIIVMVLLGFVALFRNENAHRKAFWIKAGVTAVLGVAFLLLVLFPDVLRSMGLDALAAAFSKFNWANGSFTSRLNDALGCVLIYSQNPLYGAGMGGLADRMFELGKAWNFPTNGGINSFLQLFATYGTLVGAIALFGGYRFFAHAGDLGKFTVLGLFLCFALSISMEDMTNSLFLFWILCYGLQSKKAEGNKPLPEERGQHD